MYDNYNYPYGADGPNAPWNNPEVPEKEFDVTCSQSLSRTTSLWTNNYVPGASGVDYERDVDGYSAVGWHDADDTSETNWAQEYKDCGHMTPLELLGILKDYLEKDLERVDALAEQTHQNKQFLERKLKGLIEECDCWTEDETEIFGES